MSFCGRSDVIASPNVGTVQRTAIRMAAIEAYGFDSRLRTVRAEVLTAPAGGGTATVGGVVVVIVPPKLVADECCRPRSESPGRTAGRPGPRPDPGCPR